MPSLPRKSSKGANFKTWTVDTVDALIEYFNSNWIQAGKGISVRRTASGVVIGLAKTPPVPPVKLTTGGGGSTQDIYATVSGGTAFVMLSGSTSAAKFVGTGAVTISGNTNTGNIEINATGGSGIGAPDYLHPTVARGSVSLRTSYGPYASPAYLVGSIASVVEQVAGDDYLRGDLYADFASGGSSSRVYLASFDIPTTDPDASISAPVFLVIPSGATVTLGSATDPVVSELAIYPSL